MKHKLPKVWIVFFILCLSSCYEWVCVDSPPFVGNTTAEVVEWVYTNINYSTENQRKHQSPQETLALGAGDCEDFAYLTIWLLEGIDIESEFIVISSQRWNGRTYVYCLHALVEAEGWWWDSTVNRKYEIDGDRRI
jgi:hypothetical protein